MSQIRRPTLSRREPTMKTLSLSSPPSLIAMLLLFTATCCLLAVDAADGAVKSRVRRGIVTDSGPAESASGSNNDGHSDSDSDNTLSFDHDAAARNKNEESRRSLLSLSDDYEPTNPNDESLIYTPCGGSREVEITIEGVYDDAGTFKYGWETVNGNKWNLGDIDYGPGAPEYLYWPIAEGENVLTGGVPGEKAVDTVKIELRCSWGCIVLDYEPLRYNLAQFLFKAWEGDDKENFEYIYYTHTCNGYPAPTVLEIDLPEGANYGVPCGETLQIAATVSGEYGGYSEFLYKWAVFAEVSGSTVEIASGNEIEIGEELDTGKPVESDVVFEVECTSACEISGLTSDEAELTFQASQGLAFPSDQQSWTAEQTLFATRKFLVKCIDLTCTNGCEK